MANRTKSLPPGWASPARRVVRAQKQTANRRSLRESGQVLALFVAMIFVITSLVAVVIDVAWYWSNTLEIQRAADAAALAGAPRLPKLRLGRLHPRVQRGDEERLHDRRRHGRTLPRRSDQQPSPEGDHLRPDRDVLHAPRRHHQPHASRTATAEFVLPVPMGSPENYYGTFGSFRYPAHTIPGPDNGRDGEHPLHRRGSSPDGVGQSDELDEPEQRLDLHGVDVCHEDRDQRHCDIERPGLASVQQRRTPTTGPS